MAELEEALERARLRIIELEAALREATTDDDELEFLGWAEEYAHSTDWDGEEDGEIVSFVDGEPLSTKAAGKKGNSATGDGETVADERGAAARSEIDGAIPIGGVPFEFPVQEDERPQEAPSPIIGEDQMEVERGRESGNNTVDQHASAVELEDGADENSGRRFNHETQDDFGSIDDEGTEGNGMDDSPPWPDDSR